MRALRSLTLLLVCVAVFPLLAVAEPIEVPSTASEADWLSKRRQWVAERCARKPKDPRCRRFIEQRAATKTEKVTVVANCEEDPFDERCNKIERMEERQLKLKERFELGAYCRDNPDARRCAEKN